MTTQNLEINSQQQKPAVPSSKAMERFVTGFLLLPLVIVGSVLTAFVVAAVDARLAIDKALSRK